MKPFEYVRAATSGDAVKVLAARPEGRFLAGGTNLIDLMKENVMSATDLVDVTRVDLTTIRRTKDGLVLGALAKNTDTANHPLVRSNYPLLSRAMLAAATVQIRNMATNGGNVLQRTRCPYFYDTGVPCNKRAPGSGCGAFAGLNRTHAIFGASGHCVAVHPSDMAVALAALEAKVRIQGPDGERVIPFSELHRLPEDTPERDTTLEHGEMIVSIELPEPRFQKNVYYLKVRDRTSYAFALVSVAVALDLHEGKIREARVAMGGVAHKPWRARKAEAVLEGKEPALAVFEEAANNEMIEAKPLNDNVYKVELGRRAIVRALQKASGVI